MPPDRNKDDAQRKAAREEFPAPAREEPRRHARKHQTVAHPHADRAPQISEDEPRSAQEERDRMEQDFDL